MSRFYKDGLACHSVDASEFQVPAPTHILRERYAQHRPIRVAMFGDRADGMWVDWVGDDGEIFTLRETSADIYQMVGQLWWLEWVLEPIS